jgi:DNA repair protein RadC
MPTARQRLLAAIAANPTLVDRLLVVAEPLAAQVKDSAEAYRAVAPLVAGHATEHFAVVALDRRHRVLGSEVLTTGSDAFTVVCPKQILRWALLQGTSGAAAIILAHNHPSGDPEPSQQDYEVTRRVRRAAEIIGIDVIDHIVVGVNGSYTSIATRGWTR